MITDELIKVTAQEGAIETGQFDEYGKPVTVNPTSAEIAENFIIAIKEGRIDPLQFAVIRKLVVDGLEMAAKNPEVRQIQVAEVQRHPKEKAVVHGASIGIFNRPQYEYSENQLWLEAQAELKPLKDRIKLIEQTVRDCTKSNKIVSDPETGEVIASPVTYTDKPSIAVTFKKK